MWRSTIRFNRLAVVAAIACASANCASIRVGSYADGVDLRLHRAYTWGPDDALPTGDPRLDNNPFFAEHVRAQVDKELARRGFERTTSTSADMVVHYHASVTQSVDVRTFDPSSTNCEKQDCGPFVYDAGTLFVDLVDARTNTLLWRGWAERSLDGAIDDQQWLEARITNAVSKIMQRLPRAL